MKTRVQKLGNSLAITIPRTLATKIDLKHNSPVELTLVNGKIVIEPVESELILESILSKITENNLHREVDTGPAMGDEVW